MMNELERELVGMIRESDDPERAMVIAVEVIVDYLLGVELPQGIA